MDPVLAHVVHGVGELLEGTVVVGPAGFLEQVDGLGVEPVSYTHLTLPTNSRV